jgi:Protein kinase domain
MGEVYRATDTNLKRQVAIKVLPQSVSADTERLARFQREAEVLAALNHPNIAHIHGLQKSDGTLALVMEPCSRRSESSEWCSTGLLSCSSAFPRADVSTRNTTNNEPAAAAAPRRVRPYDPPRNRHLVRISVGLATRSQHFVTCQ